MNIKKEVLILSAGEGHASLAEAAKEYLEMVGFGVKVVDLIGNGIGFGAYRAIYRFIPSLFQIPFKLAQLEKVRDMFKTYINNTKRRQIMHVLKKEQPKVVITTHFGYLPVLDEIKPVAKFGHINVVTDPITIHPLLYSLEADYNVGFGEEFVRLGLRLGIDESKLKPIGWLTRPKFFKKINKEKVLRSMSFDKDKTTLLVCGGSEGSNSVISLLPLLFLGRYKSLAQVIFIAGSNKTLTKVIRQSYKLAKKINSQILRAKVVGFTEEMDKYIGVSDIVIGKAGPNLIFEAVAMEKPFIAITHISGQEDGNLELIEKYNIGWVAEDLGKLAPLLRQIIKRPEFVKEKKEKVKVLAQENKQTGKKWVALVKKLMSS